MVVVIEFVGIARQLSGVRAISLDVEPGTSYRDIVRSVGSRFPKLVGYVVDRENMDLLPENKIVVNGQRILSETQMVLSPNEGDRLSFISVLAGG